MDNKTLAIILVKRIVVTTLIATAVVVVANKLSEKKAEELTPTDA